MIQIKFPEPSFKLRYHEDRPQIFDPIRQKWVILQDEEWVRQNMLAWLIKEASIPASYIAVEKNLPFGNTGKRFDILIYSTHHLPWMIIECKAPCVELSESVLMQILSYNSSVPVPYMMITNGSTTHLANKKAEPAFWSSAFPRFDE
jgi:hypothetical protein